MTEVNEPVVGHHRPVVSRSNTVALAMTVVVGTLLLLWGGDWLARQGAQSVLSQQVQDATGTLSSPAVRVHGFFFLPQAIAGRYDNVEIDLGNVSSGPLRVQSVHAELAGVHVSFHDVLVDEVDQVVIDQSDEDAFLTFDDLNRYLSLTGHHVSMKSTPDGNVELTGSVQVLGKTVSASAEARLSSEKGMLAVHPVRLHTNTTLDRASEILLGQRFTVLIPLDPLPFGQHITDVTVHESGIGVHASGNSIIVRR